MSVTTTSHKLKQEAQQEADITLLPLRADCSETAQLKRFSSVIIKLHENSSTSRTQNCNNRNTHMSVITTSQKPKTLGSGHPFFFLPLREACSRKPLNYVTTLKHHMTTKNSSTCCSKVTTFDSRSKCRQPNLHYQQGAQPCKTYEKLSSAILKTRETSHPAPSTVSIVCLGTSKFLHRCSFHLCAQVHPHNI